MIFDCFKRKEKYPWIEAAKGELGVKEISGIYHQTRIVEYFRATTLGSKEDEVPWCSAFVSWCLPNNGTRSAWAKSYLKYGTSLEKPKYGCIVVFDRGESKGHVGFFMGAENGKLKILGGNQNDCVCIKEYPEEKVLSYRWPPNA